MNTLLLPASRSQAAGPRHSRHWRRPFGLCLTFACLLFAPFGLQATISHAPIVGWIPDQRVTPSTPGFQTQYFRIINFDGGTFTPTKTATMDPPNWIQLSSITFAQCIVGDPCSSDGTGWKIMFSSTPTTSGTATITVTATGSTGLIGYTSFTLQVDTNTNTTANNPPSIATIPNYALPLDQTNNYVTYTALFAIGDLTAADNTEDVEDIYNNYLTDFAFASNNTSLIDPSSIYLTPVAISSDPDVAAQENHHSYILTAKTKTGVTGVATITVTLQDPENPPNVTKTSFVLQVFANTNEPPSFNTASDNKSFLVCPVPTPDPTPFQYHYALNMPTDGTSVQDLRVVATSSNTKLVSNDLNSLVCSSPSPLDGTGTVTIIPTLPLPSPSPGVPQASTITLSVEDDAYIRQSTFLYIVSPAGGSSVTAYSRPTGVYPTSGATTLLNLAQDVFLNGIMLNLQWNKADISHTYDFSDIAAAVTTVQQHPGLDISLDLVGDACYTFGDATWTWCDPVLGDRRTCTDVTLCGQNNTGFERAVPWDQNLRTARDAYLDAMNVYLTVTTNDMNYIEVVNTNLPGIETGIRAPDMISFNCTDFPGYTRQAFLGAIQDELRTVQKDFPGKLIQIGFFEATDNLGPSCTGCIGTRCYPDKLWQWLYKNASATDTNGVPLYKDENGTPLIALADEFNGVLRPRVSFFQETLAAARTAMPASSPLPSPSPSSNAPNYSTPPLTTAYTYTPITSFIPSFAFYNGTLTNDTYNNGIVFQANTVWSDPFANAQGLKYIKTVNGSPNDAMEGAFNGFHSEYLEIFQQDIDQAIPISGTPLSLNAVLWARELQSWHDYAASLRSQAPIEGPAGLSVTYVDATHLNVTCYPVYRAGSYTVDYRPLSTGTWTNVGPCDPTTPLGCTIQVSAGTEYAVRVAANGFNAAYSYAAMFLSEPANDGYISKANTSYTNHATDPEPGILAGEPGQASTHDRGFLSFHTGDLGSTTVILGAKLRLNQATSGSNFNPNSQCMVDIKNGYFGPTAGLDGSADYNGSAMTTNAFSIINVDQGNWFEANFTKSVAARNINLATDGRTQFRIYFPTGTMAGRYEGWYSGKSASYPPQLLIRYQ
jgi:hypothetical protein